MEGNQSWSEAKFSNLQHTLDEQSTRINESKNLGTSNRRALASKTKEFRKLDDVTKLVELKSLLKGYQTEIDTLTTRCKFAESCFMNVYKNLALLPDPAVLLQTKDSEIEKLKKAKEEEAEQQPKEENEGHIAKQLERQMRYTARLEKELKELRDGKPTDQQSNPATDLMNQIDDLEAQLAASKSNSANLQSTQRENNAKITKLEVDLREALGKLAVQQDYDEIKTELDELRQQDTEEILSSNPSDRVNVELRRQNQGLQEQQLTNLTRIKELNESLSEQQSLVRRLEEDLAQLNAADTFTTVSGWTQLTKQFDRPALPDLSRDSSYVGLASPVSPHPASIITEQRDRYKQRAQEYEQKCHKSQAELETKKKELEAASREIYTLYDRMRQFQHMATVDDVNANFGSQLYTPTSQVLLKELDIERRTAGLTKAEAKILEMHARAVVNDTFRRAFAAYMTGVHLALVAAIIL